MQYTPERNSLPIGTQSFEILRSENCVYVDKTEHIYNLVTEGRVYFLSRPRRFGKSLLISTLEALFKGQRELFKDTWIDAAEYDWVDYPVIRVDMTDTKRTSVELFNDSLVERLLEIANSYQVEIDHTDDAGRLLSRLIRALKAEYDKVAVLIDEYDKPILDNITNGPLAEAMRALLREFYSILNAQDENLRFVMLTGITKFSKVSVFSGLNNLEDITMVDSFGTMLGYTQFELEEVFAPWIERLANEYQVSIQEILDKLKRWYNGYQFSDNGERVYNPFSTLSVLKHFAFKNYWYKTGTPKYLVDLIEQAQFTLQEVEQLEVNELDLESHDVNQMGIVPLLYQTGYLTIAAFDQELDTYALDYPNIEVKRSFMSAVLSRLTEIPLASQTKELSKITRAMSSGDYEQVCTNLKSFFAAIPYELHRPNENYYQSIFYMALHLIGYRTYVEVSTNVGRIDAVIELEDRVLIFEFKIDQTAQTALQQIHDNHYYQPYQNQDKEIILFGVNFSTSERNITEWRQETL